MLPSQKLESFGLVYLKQALGLNGNTTLEAVGTSFTTTDINAGICITGAIVQKVRFALKVMGQDGTMMPMPPSDTKAHQGLSTHLANVFDG